MKPTRCQVVRIVAWQVLRGRMPLVLAAPLLIFNVLKPGVIWPIPGAS